MSETQQPEPQPSASPEPPVTDEQKPAAETQEQQQQEEQRPEDRRWARLTARFSTLSRERDELAQRVAQLEQARQQAATGAQPPSPELQHYVQQEAQRIAQAERASERTRDFHAAGQAAYDDWQERCQNLIAMGADPGLAALLVETPNGAKIAGELHDNPDELERIASIQSERGRAIALGQFAAKLEQRPARTVSRAPRPPQPVTGRAAPSFNEYNASAQDLVAFYTKQAMEQRRG